MPLEMGPVLPAQLLRFWKDGKGKLSIQAKCIVLPVSERSLFLTQGAPPTLQGCLEHSLNTVQTSPLDPCCVLMVFMAAEGCVSAGGAAG